MEDPLHPTFTEKGADYHCCQSDYNRDDGGRPVRGPVEEAEEDNGQEWDEIDPVEGLKFLEESINIQEAFSLYK